MKKKVAVVCGAGIGDALIMMIASHAYQRAGHEVHTFTKPLPSFGEWFKEHKFQPPSPIEKAEEVFSQYDTVILQHENSPRARNIFSLREKGVVKELITFYNNYRTTKHDPLSTSDFAFDESKSMAENVSLAVQKLLQLPSPSKDIGMVIPSGLAHKKYPKRVVIHPTSSSPQKNWLPSKFAKFARKLRAQGYQPVFAVSKEERPQFLFLTEQGIDVPLLLNLSDLAKLVYESGYFVGNDSGPGHLASYLQIPSLILAALKQSISHWRPGWLESSILLAPSWIPNIKGLRLRDEKWQHFMTVRQVLNAFKAL